jgi:hypothetical protein
LCRQIRHVPCRLQTRFPCSAAASRCQQTVEGRSNQPHWVFVGQLTVTQHGQTERGSGWTSMLVTDDSTVCDVCWGSNEGSTASALLVVLLRRLLPLPGRNLLPLQLHLLPSACARCASHTILLVHPDAGWFGCQRCEWPAGFPLVVCGSAPRACALHVRPAPGLACMSPPGTQ